MLNTHTHTQCSFSFHISITTNETVRDVTELINEKIIKADLYGSLCEKCVQWQPKSA